MSGRLSGRSRASQLASTLVLMFVLVAGPRARADGAYVPLGADALLFGRPSEGVLVLHSGYRNSPYADADALVFMGAAQDGAEADVLVVSVRVRDPGGRYEARAGRFVLSTGAVRPVHVDGITLRGRAGTGSSVELFAGLPVVPELGERAFDWLAGARLSQWLLHERLGAGASYLQRRDAGQLDDEEVGADLTAVPLDGLSLHAVGAFDLVYRGLAQARASAVVHEEFGELELFAERSVAARLLPATSLFSVIGATPSSELGSDIRWKAFPRLDLGGTVALAALDSQLGYRAALRARLRLSHEPTGGEIGAEGSRRVLGNEGWTGVLLTLELPVQRWLRMHAGLELVGADDPGDRGALWPWARAGASAALDPHWGLAAGVAARAGPEYEHEIEALVRVTYRAQVTP
jgi:hypothetical protein